MDTDVAGGETRQFSGRPLPLALSDAAVKESFRYIYREIEHPYQNSGLHAWLSHWIFGDTSLYGLFVRPFYCGLVGLALQLPFSIRKDIKRRKELRYGRCLRAPSSSPHDSSQRRSPETESGFPPTTTSARSNPAQCGEQALSARRGHRFRQIQHHSPNALPGRGAW